MHAIAHPLPTVALGPFDLRRVYGAAAAPRADRGQCVDEPDARSSTSPSKEHVLQVDIYASIAALPSGANGEHLVQKELVAIRWHAWVAEALSSAVRTQRLPARVHSTALQEVELLNDIIEHIADAALSGANAEQRSLQLCFYVGSLAGMLDRYESDNDCASALAGKYLPKLEIMRTWAV